MCGSNLEEVLGDDSESLIMITDAFEVGVLIQHCVVGVQEEVKGVLVQEVHLEQDRKKVCLLNGCFTGLQVDLRASEIQKKN